MLLCLCECLGLGPQEEIKGASKVLRLKTGLCMLNQHKSKIDQHTQRKSEVCLVNETAAHYLLHCSEFDTQRAKLMKNISHVCLGKTVFALSV